jgi:hypothetical protein
MKNLKMIGLLILASLQSVAQAYIPVNENRVLVRAFPFQNFTYDARSAGLAEAGIAISPDANSGLMNPAKLVFLNKLEYSNRNGVEKDSAKRRHSDGRPIIDSLKTFGATLNYTPYYRNLIKGMNLWGLNVYQSKNNRAYGLTVKYFDAGTTALYTDSKQFIKDFKSKEFSIAGFYSFLISNGRRSANKKNSLSVGLKYIYSNLSGTAATKGITTKPTHALAADVYFFHNGRSEREEKRWLNYGASLTSIGEKVSYRDYKQRTFQPTLLKLGIAQNFTLRKLSETRRPTTLMLTIDANKLLVPTPPIRDINNNVLVGKDETMISGLGSIFQSWGTAPNGLKEHLQEIYYSFGAELNFKEFLSGRIGYYAQNKNKGDIHYLSLGLGAKLKGFSLDAALLFPNKTNNIFKNTFRVSLTYSLN